jgi:sporulation protein YlmC with PRC-barrel domain
VSESAAALRVGARIEATDGEAGTLDALIVDPITRRVTYLVLNDESLGPRRLVPVALVSSSDPDLVTVASARADLDTLPPFDEPGYNTPDAPGQYGETELDPGFYFLEPYATPIDGWLLAEHERIPKDEVAIRRGAEVVAADETHVGHVDEFLIDLADGQVTHLVVRTGHLFKKRDVIVPVPRASRFDDDRVRIDLTVDELEALPKVPVKRHRHLSGG